MSQNDTPDWIQNLDLSNMPEPGTTFSAKVDGDILQALQTLSLDELSTLADISGVREHQGVLTPPGEWSRDQYIEVLSDVGEMLDPQVVRIKKYLGI